MSLEGAMSKEARAHGAECRKGITHQCIPILHNNKHFQTCPFSLLKQVQFDFLPLTLPVRKNKAKWKPQSNIFDKDILNLT